MNSPDERDPRLRRTFCGATPGVRFLATLSFISFVFAYLLVGLISFRMLHGGGAMVVVFILLVVAFGSGISSRCPMGSIIGILAFLSLALFFVLAGSGGVA